MSSGFFEVDDVSLPFFIEGEGIPCIVTNDPDYHRKLLSQQLREHFKFIFTETRVFHIHDHPVNYTNITVDTLIEDIEKLRNHLDLNQIAILGPSIGGLFALEYAKKHPENVSHLILLNTPPKLDYWLTIEDYWITNASEERVKEYQKRKDYLEKSKDKLSPEELATMEMTIDAPFRWFDTSFDSSYLYDGYRLNGEGYAHIMNHMVNSYDVKADTPVTVPVFMSQSIYDHIVPYRLWDDYMDVFSDLTLHMFEKSGHNPHFEEQELFDKLLLEWLETH
jgi:proline iminopeptidase